MKLGEFREHLRTEPAPEPARVDKRTGMESAPRRTPRAPEDGWAPRAPSDLADELMGSWDKDERRRFPPNVEDEVKEKGRMSLTSGHVYWRRERDLVKVIDVYDAGVSFGPVKVQWHERGKRRQVDVALNELYRIQHDVRCRTCGGGGWHDGANVCHNCDGIGWVLTAKSIAPFKIEVDADLDEEFKMMDGSGAGPRRRPRKTGGF